MPTLCLNMIVRNESKIILRCLKSVVKWIDFWIIVDTGSTDNTKELIKDFFAEHNIPGELHEKPFVNFGVSRTHALDLAYGKSDYILLCDADMELIVYDQDFKSKLVCDMYLVLQGSGFVYYNTRIVPGRKHCKYVGVTHEYVECTEPHTKGTLERDIIRYDDKADGGTRSEKFERDIRLFLEDMKTDPNNARSWFYLARSYQDRGDNSKDDLNNAINAYKKRIELGNWFEEIYYSWYQIGKCYQSLGKWEHALEAYLSAYDFRPERAEPLYEIAKHYRLSGKNKLAYNFAKIGLDIPFPKEDMLFLSEDVYRYQLISEISISAYYVLNKMDVGYKACEILIHDKTLGVSNDTKNMAEQNRFFYAQSLSSQISNIANIHIQEIVVNKTQPHHNICNPSIIALENGDYCLNVREVSYSFDIKANYYHFKDTIDTHNHLLYIKQEDIDNIRTEHHTINPAIVDNIISEDTTGLIEIYPNQVTGFEDVRLIEFKNAIWCVCTCRLTNPAGDNEIVLFKLNSEYKMEKILRLKGYEDNRCQKNWTPFVENNELYILYSSEPTIILKPDLETGQCEIIKKIETTYDYSRYRGSSQLLPYNNGYLYIIHEVTFRDNRRYYLHRFVFMDSNHKIQQVSPIFYLVNKTIEFVSGMSYDHLKQNVYITLGYEDKKAYLVKLAITEIEYLLENGDLTNNLAEIA